MTILLLLKNVRWLYLCFLINFTNIYAVSADMEQHCPDRDENLDMEDYTYVPVQARREFDKEFLQSISRLQNQQNYSKRKDPACCGKTC